MRDRSLPPGPDAAAGPASTQAEQCFASFLDRCRSQEAPDPVAFLAAQPEALRPYLARLLEDWQEVRDLLGGRGSGLRAGRQLGDFRLLRQLGRGGMGVVWEAEQLSLGRRVALKLMSPRHAGSGVLQQRFFREAVAGARLGHPGIVQVHAVGEADGLAYIVQELVPGGRTLADRLAEVRERVHLPEDWYRETAGLFASVAGALHFAHDADIVHRDVKPANILLAADGSPKLTDFGLAQVEDDLGLSRTGELMGTPFYMSPEQVLARRIGIDRRTDVFSLGATLYEALTLVRPFEGDTSQQVLEKITLWDPPDARRVRSRVPRDLAVICAKALEKQRERRYQTMREMAADLRRWLADEPIQARPPGPGRRAAKWCRRHPVVSGTGSVASVALAVIAVLLVQVAAARDDALTAERQERVQRQAAEDAAATARREAATSQRVLDFLLGLFEESDPARLRGAEVTVREVLDRGVQRIDTGLEEEPLIRARILNTMGALYLNLGVYDEADRLLAAAVEARRGIVDPDDPDALTTSDHLGLLRLLQGRFDEAETLFQEVLVSRRRVLGEAHEDTLSTAANLALLYRYQGRLDEAEPLLRQSLEDCRRLLGPEHLSTLSAMANLALLCRQVRKPSEAESLYREALAALERIQGEDHPATLTVRGNLGMLYWDEDRFAEAEPLLARTLADRRRVLGDDHPETLGSINNLALLYNDQRRYDEAQALYREALAGLRASLGNSHPNTQDAIYNLASSYAASARFADALPLARELLELTPEDSPYRADVEGLLRRVQEGVDQGGG